MKPQNYFRFSLFIPYLLWVLCLLIALPVTKINAEYPPLWDIIFMPAMFYLIGVLFWFLPYTILAITLWLWSAGKPVPALRRAGLISPVLFSFLIIIEVSILFITTGDLAELAENALAYSAFFGGLGVTFGYFCVGIAFGVFKFLQAKNKMIFNDSPQEVLEI